MIKISSEKIVAKIDEFGAYITDLKYNDMDILYPKTELEISGNLKLRGGSHVCFPVFGPAQKIGLNQHGFGRELEWNILEVSENSVKLHLKNKFESWRDMEATLEYIVKGETLVCKLKVKNKGGNDLQISPGFHPYFKLYGEKEFRIDGENINFDDPKLRDTLFKKDVKELETKRYIIKFKNQDLSKFAIWTDQVDDYICVEPTNRGIALSKGEKLLLIRRGETKSFSFEILISEIKKD
ncbi:MAG: hypothetical protein Q4A42_06460 [Tissierellia bacterium]|nr:hypothetical protein [Tissierellia bacterium]